MKQRKSIYQQAMERETKNKKKPRLDDYKIDIRYMKGGGGFERGARGYKDMRATRGEIYHGSIRYKGGRAYRQNTVNTTKGRKVK